MIELWVPITIAAAFSQNLRSALQKHLTGSLGTMGATAVRFVYGVPLALGYVAGLAWLGDWPLPTPGATFFVYALIGGLAQILATALLLKVFSLGNFAVGTTYSKTETIQAALFGAVVLGDRLTLGTLSGIIVSLFGVMVISAAKSGTRFSQLATAWTSPAALIGIGSGAMFGISAVSYRAASLSLGGPGFLMQAAFTLAVVIVFQSAVVLVYLRLKEPGQVARVFAAWRPATLVGISGVIGSIGWFTAMTLQNAAYVRALGQIELVFTFIASYFIFRERTNRLEVAGILLVIGGIVGLVLTSARA